MAVNGEVFVCGAYAVSFNGVSVGIFQGDDAVPTITPRRLEEPIASTDRYGRTRIDAVHMGVAVEFSGTLLEYPKALPMLGILQSGSLGTIGTLLRSWARPLVLTSTAGTPAANAPASLTAGMAALAADFPVALKFGPQLRVVPVKMDLYPYMHGNPPAPVFFTTA